MDETSAGGQTAALRWIVDLLRARAIPFQVVGGLAARAYGARRALADIDVYVPTDRLAEIAEAAAADPSVSVVRPPAPHRDETWDLTFAAFDYDGQRVELGGVDGARYFDRRAGCWRAAAADFGRSVPRSVLGVVVPIIACEALVRQKRALDREVDRLDLAEIDRPPGRQSCQP